MTLKALCIRCGGWKKRPAAKCSKCGFAPSSESDLAKSFILSAAFDVDERTIGRSPSELAHISDAISAGAPYPFSDSEIAVVKREIAAFRAITPRRLVVDLAKWIGPPLLILALGYAVLWVAR